MGQIGQGLLLAAIMIAGGRSALGFSIESVVVEPAQGVGAGDPVSLKVRIETAMPGAWLYAASRITRQGGRVTVNIYPTVPRIIGAWVIGSMIETVPLGTFPVGPVDYIVEIHPDSSDGWGTRRVEGRFQVGMKLLAGLDAGAIRLSWRGTGAKVRLERSVALGAPTVWEIVTNKTTAVEDTATFAVEVEGDGAFYRLVDGCVSNVAPTVSNRLSGVGKLANRRNPIVVLAEATDEDGEVERVEFLVNGTRLGEDMEAPYSVTWTNAPSGVHRIQAVAWDDCGGTGTAKEFQLYAYNGQDVVECTQTHLASLFGGVPAAYLLVSIENVNWPNACLGCMRGVACAQIVTPGKRILMSGPGGDYEIHTSDSGRLVLCQGTGLDLGSCR